MLIHKTIVHNTQSVLRHPTPRKDATDSGGTALSNGKIFNKM